MLQHKKITVFGGSGFLGRYVIQKLAKQGALVTVVTRDPDSALFLKSLGEVGQIQLFRLSSLNEENLNLAIKGADAVINLIGTLKAKSSQTFEKVHVGYAAAIAKVTVHLRIKSLVHVSALGADETEKSKYFSSKGKGEKCVRQHFPEAIILRPSLIFGPEDNTFNQLAWLVRHSLIFPLWGGGKTKFQPLYVGDMAEAIVRILSNCSTTFLLTGKILELGGPQIYTFQEIIHLVMHITRHHRPLLPLPFFLADFMARMLQFFPNPFITPEHIKLLKKESIVHKNNLGFKELDIQLQSLPMILPTYLKRYRYYG